MTTAKVIEDSVNRHGKRMTTLQLKYPRFIHSEFMTHRVFSRNASSSRAIPVAKMLEQVRNDPAMPVHWGANQAGMQAHAELPDRDKEIAKGLWLQAAQAAANCAEAMTMKKIQPHKQIVNRLLEPFQWIHVVVTATEFDNFFALRDHADAQPEIRLLARSMREAMDASKPRLLLSGDWHLPYLSGAEWQTCLAMDDSYAAQKISAARCARVSYLTHDGSTPEISKDLQLFERLAGGVPLHASPLEHQATPGDTDTGNFQGWTQFRKIWEKLL